MSDEPSNPEPKQDVVLLGPPTADGGGVHVLRARKDQLEAGELRPVQEGKPLSGELLSLAPRKDNPRILDVKGSYVQNALPSLKGPAQVATKAYRDNWDEVFSSGATSPRDLN